MIENFAQGRAFHGLLENKVMQMTALEEPKKVKAAKRDAATNTEMKEEEFTTPSVIFKDMKQRLSISDKDLETARKQLRTKSKKMSAIGFDSIFKKPTIDKGEDTCYIMDDMDFNRELEDKPAASSSRGKFQRILTFR